jgi:DNA polymerase-1
VASRLLAIDTETTGVGWHDNAFMVSASYYGTDNEYHNWVWDFRDPDMDHDHAYEEIEFYITTADKIIMHNAKFDIQKLCRMGYPLDWFKDKFEDTQAIAHLIDEQQSTSLKYLARTVLGEQTDEDEVLKVWRRKNKIKKEEGYEPIPNEILAPYAAKDAEFTLRLYEVLRNQMPEDLQPLYQIEKDLTLALLGIEAKGMQIDKTYVKKQRQEYGDRIYKLKRVIGNLAGEEFNPQSPKQILEVFAQRGLRITATDKATLSALDDELAVAIVELREANKIKSTYFDGLHDEASDGILHPNFRQHGTRTGRMSSGTAEA